MMVAVWYGRRPSFPPPPVFGRSIGRSRYADRLRPHFFETPPFQFGQFREAALAVFRGKFHGPRGARPNGARLQTPMAGHRPGHDAALAKILMDHTLIDHTMA